MTAEPASRLTLEPVLAAHLDTLASGLGSITDHTARLVDNSPNGSPPITGRGSRSRLSWSAPATRGGASWGEMMGNAAAAFMGIPEVRFFSAGTDSECLQSANQSRRSGRSVSRWNPPRMRRHEGPGISPTRATSSAGARGGSGAIEFSKALGDPWLPKRGFAAVMVCDEADAGCPFVPGAALRLSMPFSDPKTFDGTVQEQQCYAVARDALGRLMMAAMGETCLRLDSC